VVFNSRTIVIPLSFAVWAFTVGFDRPVFAQTAPASTQAAQKNWKDRAEYDLYEAITKETTPSKRLEYLNSWKDKYPLSDFADARQQLFMSTFSLVGRVDDALATSGEILAKDPNNLQALSAALTAIFSLQTPTPDQLAIAERASGQVSSNLDALFAADKKPAKVSSADWVVAKKSLQLLSQNALAYVAWRQNNFEKAEAEFTKSLELDPNQGQVSYWLSNVILAERKPEKYSAALYDMARAAAYDGAGSLNAAGRQQVMASFQKTYGTYHGSAEGADQVLAQAKTAAQPPAGFTIASKADLQAKQMQAEEELRKANPQLALWKSIREALTGPQAEVYFNEHMKGAELPELKGKLIEAKPETKPKVLVLAVENGATPDVTLNLAEALSGKMEPGAEIGFKGTASGYTASPFMVTFELDKKNVTGWKGAPAAAPAKRAPVRHAPKKT
jgi:tetratricopeptide (TPR) repeat protein